MGRLHKVSYGVGRLYKVSYGVGRLYKVSYGVGRVRSPIYFYLHIVQTGELLFSGETLNCLLFLLPASLCPSPQQHGLSQSRRHQLVFVSPRH